MLRAATMVPAECYAAFEAAAWISPSTLPQRSTIASRPSAAPSMAGQEKKQEQMYHEKEAGQRKCSAHLIATMGFTKCIPDYIPFVGNDDFTGFLE
ncbi:hypothetical protein U9M48_010436 [Paspalum notatum var. saurae]|uniref:Uncharacterized protein n=1 Tax=Paspalum notatum var. saurae TaxID=547442 RepID=A0AAQ3STG0_PASNO